MHCAWFLNIVGLGIVVKEASLKYTIQESDNGLDYAYMSKNQLAYIEQFMLP